MPIIRRSFREVRARIVEIENLAVVFSLARHLFGAGLAESDSMAGAAAVEENAVSIIAKFIEIAADFVPAECAIYRKTKRRSRNKGVWKSATFEAQALSPAAF